MQPYRDERLKSELDDADQAAQWQADDQWSAFAADIAAEMQQADDEIGEILRRHQPALDELNRELQERRERLAELAGRVLDRFTGTEFEVPFRPTAREPDIDTRGMLYDSRRTWADQLAAFKAAKARSDDHAGAA